MTKYVQAQKFFLSGSGVVAGATSIVLRSLAGIDGTLLTMSDFGSIGYFTLEPGNGTQEEQGSFTGITQNSNGTATLTGVSNISFISPYTTTSGLSKTHGGGAELVISNTSGFYSQLLARDNNEIITGYFEAPNPITAQGLVTRDYILALINGGSITTNALIEAGTAGETVSAGNVLYLKASDGRWYKALATTAATVDLLQLGIAQGAGTAGGAITGGVLRRGLDTHQSGGSAGAIGYASNTGTVATTAGTIERAIGNFITTTTFAFDPAFYYLPTALQKAGLAGSQGTIGPTNKYLSQDNTSDGGIDQSQATQNGTEIVGEANTTLKKNKIAQSFIPTVTKIRGVKLYKIADTGTFTGTVTIALQADTTGSPSGANLASLTLTNAQWLATSTGEFVVNFSTEYTTLTVGSLYWIVISTSTADNSNHPNVGNNTAGGYANGSCKYNNTTDGWVTDGTIDLYFKTLYGITAQVVKTGASGVIDDFMLPVNYIVGAGSPLYPKAYTNFQIPMIGTSAAILTGCWTSGSAETILMGHGMRMTGTGGEICSFIASSYGFYIWGAAGQALQFNDTNVFIMDYWAILPTAAVDTIVGFYDNAPGAPTAYNFTANAAVCFTTNNGTLYGLTCTGSSSSVTAIPFTVTVSKLHNYRIVMDLNADTAYFYVDGNLVLTQSANFPTSAAQISTFMSRSATGTMYVSNPWFSLKTF